MRRRALLSGSNIDYSNCFAMIVTAGGSITWTSSITNNTLSYSKDNGTTWSIPYSKITISVVAGDKVLWKGTPTPQSYKGIGMFNNSLNTRYSVEGNVMSLLYGDEFNGKKSLVDKSHALYGLFSGNTNITSAENLSLPATTLASSCYQQMFTNCTNLTTAPELPATTLASGCYYNMFNGCTSLTTAPSLPAKTLEANCYVSMFYGCTSLTTAPVLSATTLANNCYSSMFSRCTSLSSITCLATNISATNCTANWLSGVAATGTFTKAASMTSWTTGVNGIPSGWTVQDAS